MDATIASRSGVQVPHCLGTLCSTLYHMLLWQYTRILYVILTSVDAKHHGASLSERWNVTWVGNKVHVNYNSPNQKADIH